MTVRYYRWDDTSAPTLNNAAGSLVTLLDAVLVNGYGSQTAAGWAIAFTGTNKRVYRAASGVRPYIRFDDNVTGHARGVRMAEAMTDVDTITSNPCPTVAQASDTATIVYRSADANNRPWVIAASETAFCLYIGHDNTTAQGLASTTVKSTYFFGEFFSYLPGDAFNALIICNTVAQGLACSTNTISQSGAAVPGTYALRAVDQTTLSVAYSRNVDYRTSAPTSFGAGGSAYPDPITGGMLLSPIYVTQGSGALTRGKLPGWWAVLHNLPGSPGDTFAGTGALAGKTFLLLDSSYGSGTRARIALEISDTWS